MTEDILPQGQDSLVCDSGFVTLDFNCIPRILGVPLRDGDAIFVSGNAPDIIQRNGPLFYQSLAENRIVLDVPEPVLAAGMYTNLKFDVVPQDGCRSGIVVYTTDSFSTSCVLSIDSFEALEHDIFYPTESDCQSSEIITPITDVPAGSIVFSAEDTGLIIDIDGRIFPMASIPGNYSISASSDYCMASDTFHFDIYPAPDIDIVETVYACPGTPFDQILPDIPNATVLPDIGQMEDYITNSGTYHITIRQGPCEVVETFNLQMLEVPEFEVNLKHECDRIIAETQFYDKRDYTINWSNGDSGPGTSLYSDAFIWVNVSDEQGCIASDSLNVKLEILDLVSVDYQKKEADCWEEGSLTLERGQILNAHGSFNYRLRNNLTGQLLSDFYEVPEGDYSLQVVDERNCVAEYPEKITVIQRCLENYPVFTPDGDNIEDTYFIPHEGSVSIYDRGGRLIRTINTPAYWDGTDGQNRALPMGNYLLITDKEKVVNITIVR
jgi:hypothetical protein